MKLYKLTNENDCTKNNTKWEENKTISLPICNNPKICSKDVIHAYKSVNLALLLNPLHCGFDNPNIWEADGDVVVEDWGKIGCFSLTTTKKIDIPNWYDNEKTKVKIQIMFAILCAESVLKFYKNKYPKR